MLHLGWRSRTMPEGKSQHILLYQLHRVQCKCDCHMLSKASSCIVCCMLSGLWPWHLLLLGLLCRC